MPPSVWVFFAGTLVSTFILKLGKPHLINVPDPLKHGIVFPQFGDVFNHAALLFPLAYLVITLILIDGTESLATIAAVDKIDTNRRRSDPDQTLLAMGVSNGASSLFGGLTIIPGIVKSTANILAGGRTQWANFYNACFLLMFLLLGGELIELVPMTVLAAILVFIGYKLCKPAVWRNVARVGTDEFVIFSTTVLVTVTTDLLIGIATGIVLKLLLNLWYVRRWRTLRAGSGFAKPSFAVRFLNLFRNPVSQREFEDGTYHLYLDGPLVCFNLFHVIRELGQLPHDTRAVHVHLSTHVPLVDHTTVESLRHFEEEFSGQEQSPSLVIDGWDHLRPLSNHEASTRILLGPGEELGDAQATD